MTAGYTPLPSIQRNARPGQLDVYRDGDLRHPIAGSVWPEGDRWRTQWGRGVDWDLGLAADADAAVQLVVAEDRRRDTIPAPATRAPGRLRR